MPSTECVKVLLAAGADPNRRCDDGDFSLYRATRSFYRMSVDLLQLLVRHGANVNRAMPKGSTPAMALCLPPRSGYELDYLEGLRALHKAGANLNARTTTGLTALDFAVKMKQQSIAAWLRKNGGRSYQTSLPAELKQDIVFLGGVLEGHNSFRSSSLSDDQLFELALEYCFLKRRAKPLGGGKHSLASGEIDGFTTRWFGRKVSHHSRQGRRYESRGYIIEADWGDVDAVEILAILPKSGNLVEVLFDRKKVDHLLLKRVVGSAPPRYLVTEYIAGG